MLKLILITVSLFHTTFSLASTDPAISCFKQATSGYGLRLSDAEAAYLCSGAESDAPLECLRRTFPAAGLHLKTKDALVLCQGARSMNPISCYRETFPVSSSLRISDAHAVLLCREKGTTLPEM